MEIDQNLGVPFSTRSPLAIVRSFLKSIDRSIDWLKPLSLWVSFRVAFQRPRARGDQSLLLIGWLVGPRESFLFELVDLSASQSRMARKWRHVGPTPCCLFLNGN